MKRTVAGLVVIGGLLLGTALFQAGGGLILWRDYLLGLVYQETMTPERLRVKYQTGAVKILLVPGHDKDFGGAAFAGVREEKLNLLLAEQLFKFLNQDPRFVVSTARDFASGEYAPSLGAYFTTHQQEIEEFRAARRDSFLTFVQEGRLSYQKDQPHHNFARPEVSLRLYGINKWANEQDIDVVLHLHFNDDPLRNLRQPGRYSGLAVYIPERQYPNARVSASLAQVFYNNLARHFLVSDLPQERGGIVEDQDLIAVGSYASRAGASLLIEYAYIYEPQIVNSSINHLVLSEMAWQTYLGLKKYFEPEWPDSTLLLPYQFERELAEGLRGSGDVLALQRFLQLEGLYPPPGLSNGHCPLNGNFGPCVEEAVKNFQIRYGLPATGYVGQLTLEKLRHGSSIDPDRPRR